MKKTTSAFLAALLSTTVLGAGMLLIGANPGGASNSTSVSTAGSTSSVQFQQSANGSQSAAAPVFQSRAPVLRTSGS
jgi:hypothetical protein